MCFRRTDVLESCWCSVRTRKAKSFYVHAIFLHCAPLTLCGFAVAEDIHFSQVVSPSTSTKSLDRRDLLLRNGQATPIPQGGNGSRRTMSNSLPALPSVHSDEFHDTVEITNPTTMQKESASRSNTMQKTHCIDQEGVKTLSRDQNLRNLPSET